MDKQEIVLGITGASGSIYGIRTLATLLQANFKVHLICSKTAKSIALQELNVHLDRMESLEMYLKLPLNSDNLLIEQYDNLWAFCSSGSYRTCGMLIAPCSMTTLASIACGLADNLITRAADVVLKEFRPLALMPRETPFNQIHLENMLKLSRMGVKIVPPIPGFYAELDSVSKIVDFAVGKLLDSVNIDHHLYRRWGSVPCKT